MNYKVIFFLLGYVMNVLAAFMLIPLGIALYYGEHATGQSFLLTMVLLLVVGLFLIRKTPENKNIFAKEGFWVVGLAWIVLSFFGSLPFYVSGAIPSFLDCLFESTSGFTTTGASIVRNVEALPRSLLFWRCLTHWLGGMGVLIFILSVASLAGGNTLHLMRAEFTGPAPGKLVPKIRSTAKILYGIYIGLTLLEILFLLAGGMSLFDSAAIAFSTAGTGGFAVHNASIGAFDNAYFHWVIAIFMLVFGINFNFMYLLLIRNFYQARRMDEVWIYFAIIGAAFLLVAYNIYGAVYPSPGEALRHGFFQVVSIITSTGFAIADYDAWPQFSQGLLVLLMFVGACAGSTGGGVKVARVAIVVKNAAYQLRRLVHPRAVEVLEFNGKKVEEETLSGTHLYFTLYFLILGGSTLVLAWGGYSLETSFSAALACLNNIGPGLDQVGPVNDYGFFFPLGKVMLIFNMLAGRLEIFPILMLFAPGLWRPGKTRRRRSRSVSI